MTCDRGRGEKERSQVGRRLGDEGGAEVEVGFVIDSDRGSHDGGVVVGQSRG